MHKSVRAAAAAFLLVLSIPLHAQDPAPDTVIVTATRTAQTADEALAAVTVLTLVVPNVTTSAPGPEFTEAQLAFAGIVEIHNRLVVQQVDNPAEAIFRADRQLDRHGSGA